MMNRLPQSLGLLIALVILVFAISAPAATTIELAIDPLINNASAVLELKLAITNANSELGDYVGRDTIRLYPNGVYNFMSAHEGGDNALPDLISEIDIDGRGATLQRDSGAPNFRILNVGLFGSIGLENLTIKGGRLGGQGAIGAGVNSLGFLSMSNCTISDNLAIGSVDDWSWGGGIANANTLVLSDCIIEKNEIVGISGLFTIGGGLGHSGLSVTILRCEFKNNKATQSASSRSAFGGGMSINHLGGSDQIITITDSLFDGNSTNLPNNSMARLSIGGAMYIVVNNTQDVTIERSLFVNNSAINESANGTLEGGGAIEIVGNNDSTGNIDFINTTFSGNSVETANNVAYGGAVLISKYSGGNLSVDFEQCTITKNSVVTASASRLGGGIYVVAGDVTLHNTIVSDNLGSALMPDIGGTFVSKGYNIIGDSTGATFTPTTGDKVDVDPLLGPLADNGGPTQTHSIPPNSPAVDAGDPVAFAGLDQRGFLRPADGNNNSSAQADIGAFELFALPPLDGWLLR